jgi:hypothetical protein
MFHLLTSVLPPRSNLPQPVQPRHWRRLASRRGNRVNENSYRLRHRLLSSLIICLIAFEFAIAGQTETGLKILVMKGSEAETVVSKLARPITVRIVAGDDRPVSGATVVFTMPDGNPSSDFVDGSKSVLVFTNMQGIATSPQYRANSAEGAYQIQVRAAYMSQVARVSIEQTNMASKKSSRKMFVIAAAAAGVAAAAIAGKGSAGGDQTAKPPVSAAPPTIVFAGASVSGPR